MPSYTFNHVIVTVDAPTAAEAYTKLCNAFATDADIGFSTETFNKYESGVEFTDENIPTSRIFPDCVEYGEIPYTG